MVPARAPKTYSILLAHNLTLLREGMAALCRAEPQYHVLNGCSDGATALRLIESQKPDIVLLDFNLTGSGLITGQRLSTRLEQHLQQFNIEQLERRFVAVATELGTGHEVWLNKGSLVNALKASFALPGIFRPVQINGRWLIDGALVNPIPVSVCRALGARIVIAVNLSNDVFSKGAVIHDQEPYVTPAAAPQSDGQELLGSNGRAAVHLLHRQIFGRSDAPGMSAVMMDAINITQDRIARSRLAGDPPDILIAPKTGSIGLFDFHRGAEAIELGARATEKLIDEIKLAVRALAA